LASGDSLFSTLLSLSVQPAYKWPVNCRLDVTKPQAYWELMNSSNSGIYADLLFALRDLELGRELPMGRAARGSFGLGRWLLSDNSMLG
jgi:hypothetical protein